MARHLREDNPEILIRKGGRPSIAEDTDYATARVRNTHDLHHIVTGPEL